MEVTFENVLDALPYFIEIVEKANIVELARSDKDINSAESIEKRGIKLITKAITQNYKQIKPNLLELVAALQGTSAEEVKKMKPAKAIKVIIELFKDKELIEVFTDAMGSATEEQ
jgi:hypothetical protein